MILKPLESADLTLVELRDDGHIGRLTPHCKVHGAMNEVTPAGLWRCMAYTVEARPYQAISSEKKKRNEPPPRLIENGCRAGCVYGD